MSSQTVTQVQVVEQTTPTRGQVVEQIAFYNADGTIRYIPKQAAAQADVAALTQAAITGGESPTEAEFNALLADHAATRTVVNSLLGKLRTAGVIAT